MRRKVKLAVFALSAGTITLAIGSCFFRFLGDLVGDAIMLRMID